MGFVSCRREKLRNVHRGWKLWYLTSEVQFCHSWLIVKCSARAVLNSEWLFMNKTIPNTGQKWAQSFTLSSPFVLSTDARLEWYLKKCRPSAWLASIDLNNCIKLPFTSTKRGFVLTSACLSHWLFGCH